MGIVLFFIASVLWIPLTVINLIAVLIKKVKSNGFLKVINGYFFDTAVDIDRFGNRTFRTILNITLHHNGSLHGDEGETISSVLGKNQRDNKLTCTGKIICFILDSLDKNHCQNSIKEPQKKH